MDTIKLIFLGVAAFLAGFITRLLTGPLQKRIEEFSWYKRLSEKQRLWLLIALAIFFAAVPITDEILSRQPHPQRESSVRIVSVTPEAGTPLSYFDLVDGVQFSAVVEYDSARTLAEDLQWIPVLQLSSVISDSGESRRLRVIMTQEVGRSHMTTRGQISTTLYPDDVFGDQLLLGLSLTFYKDQERTQSTFGENSYVDIVYPIEDRPVFELASFTPEPGTTLAYSDLVSGIPFSASFLLSDSAEFAERGHIHLAIGMATEWQPPDGEVGLLYLAEVDLSASDIGDEILIEGMLRPENAMNNQIAIWIEPTIYAESDQPFYFALDREAWRTPFTYPVTELPASS